MSPSFVRRTDEATLPKVLVESSILLAASRGNLTSVLLEAAKTYKVDTDAIELKVKQDFVTKQKAKRDTKPVFPNTNKSRKAA